MKVLVSGKDRMHRIDCPGCNARLEYVKEDIKEQHIPIYDGEAIVIETYVECPDCKEKIFVKNK